LHFLYREVLRKDKDLEIPIDSILAKKPNRLPTVLTREEVRRDIGWMSCTHWMMTRMLYGNGLRLGECLRLLAME
jgi:integrase